MTNSEDDNFEEEISTANVNIFTPEFLEDRRVAKRYNNNAALTR
jgi:hypothetical protein